MNLSPLFLPFLSAALSGALLVGCGTQKSEHISGPLPRDSDTLTVVRIAAIGDVMTHLPQTQAAEIQPGVFDFDFGLQFIAPALRGADLAIANLETTHGGAPWAGFPCFSSPDTLAWSLKRAGIDLALMANNHVLDRGRRGLVRTCAVLDRVGLRRTGAFMDSTDLHQNHPLMLNVKGIQLAVLNYTYGTNGIPVPSGCHVNSLDTTEMKSDILRARSLGAEAIIACLHWGQEYRREPHSSQLAISRLLIREGVSVILGSHPHVVQPIQVNSDKNGRPSSVVVYSLGNAISHMKDRYCESGMAVFVEFQKRGKQSVTLSSLEYLPFWVYKGQMQGRRVHVILPERDRFGIPSLLRIPTAQSSRMYRELTDLRSLISAHSPAIREFAYPFQTEPGQYAIAEY